MIQGNTNRKRVLVVEDEPMISRVCRKTLTAGGFEVDIAINGLVAKEMLDKKTYDLCLTDIRTPVMNGIEFYRYLQKEHLDLAGKVIFTTGDVLSGNIDAFLREVNRPFLPKPFTPDELKKVVIEALK
jgi:CheY-like chemotaxis protein